MLGFIPSEFVQHQGEGELKTIFLSDAELVPAEIPDNTLFLAKQNATISDFTTLFTIFDESFLGDNFSVVIFALGKNDISFPEKRLVFNEKTQTLDFHPVQKSNNNFAFQIYNSLIEVLCEFGNVSKVLSMSPMSRQSSGFHNRCVFHVDRKTTKVDEKHAHLSICGRYQRNLSRNRPKPAIYFPLVEDRFDESGGLRGEEKQMLASAALVALESTESVVVVGDAHFKKKF